MRFAKPSSTSSRAAIVVAALASAGVAALVGVATGGKRLAYAGLTAALAAAGAAVYLLRDQESARLLEEAQEREAERARLSDQLIAAEQDERRRLALFLHDVPVQAMSGIALMLDGVVDAIDRGKVDDAKEILGLAVERQRHTIRDLRDLSFALEPVVLRDQGFGPAVHALAEQVGVSHQVRIDLDVEAGERLAERAQIVLYQIIRESLDAAIRRGPPTRISVSIAESNGGTIEATITDDGAGERRRRVFEALEERARTLQGRVTVDRSSDERGTALRVTLPPYTARG
ncbi:MAG: histidine kinase [Actinomycetota bacterium]|nr:histidine kinase [Actinomycetota bacterium]